MDGISRWVAVTRHSRGSDCTRPSSTAGVPVAIILTARHWQAYPDPLLDEVFALAQRGRWDRHCRRLWGGVRIRRRRAGAWPQSLCTAGWRRRCQRRCDCVGRPGEAHGHRPGRSRASRPSFRRTSTPACPSRGPSRSRRRWTSPSCASSICIRGCSCHEYEDGQRRARRGRGGNSSQRARRALR